MNEPQRRQLDILWLVPVLLVAAFLRTQRITEVSYWFDEAFCLKMTEFPLLDLLNRACQDPHPPLFYLVLKGWLGIFGHSVFAARMLDVTFGLATVLGVFLFVREIARLGRDDAPTKGAVFTAVLAAAFVALSPFHIKWSLLVRMYSLGTALAAFSSYFLLRALRETSASVRDWRLFTVTAILMVYTHYFGLFTVAAEFLFALGYRYLQQTQGISVTIFERLRPVLISAVCVYVAWLPWMIPFLDHRQLVDEHFRIPPLTLEMVEATLYTAFDLELLHGFSSTAGLIMLQICFMIVIVTLVSRRPGNVYVALAASFPILAAVLVSLFMRHIFVQRYFLFVQMFLLTAVAVLVGRIPWRPVKLSISLVLVVVMANQAWRQYEKRERDAQLPGMRGAMAYLDSNRAPNDPLVVCNPMLYQPAIRHTRNRSSMFVMGSAQQYPFYQGTAVMRNDEYLSNEQIAASVSQRLWTLGAERWFNGAWTVPVPVGWKEIGQWRFAEFNAELVLRQYQRDET